MSEAAKNIKRRNAKKASKDQQLYCGMSLPFLSLLVISVVILCNWLIDFQSLFEWAMERVQNKSMDKMANLAGRKQPPSVKSGWLSISRNKLKKLPWSESMMTFVASQNYPILLEDQSVKEWPLFKQNLLDIGMKTNMSLDGTRWQPIPVFVLGQDRDKGGMIGSRKDHPVMYTNVSLLQFISATFDNNTYLYWTGELSVWNEQLKKYNYDVAVDEASSANPTATGNETRFNDWRDFRIRESGIADKDSDDDLWRPMLWVSHPGVTAQTHYDTQHNIFIQVQGTKRFLLFSPGTELYTYPNIHRSYRQSQVHFETTLAPEFSSLFPYVNPTNTSAIEVILHPGDVLYIPPYWQHRVESLTLSVSLSILSPSYLEASLAEIMWESVPLGEFSGRDMKGQAVRLYLNKLIQNLPSKILGANFTLAKFAADLHSSRFATLERKQKRYNNGICFEPLTEESSQLIANSTEKFSSAAKNIASLLQDVECEPAIKRVFLYDYIEQIVRWAVGPEYTAGFILECLTE